MDTGLALAGAGANTGAKSGLVARPASPLPGDKPLVSPAKTSSPTSSAPAAESREDGASSESKATTRKAPVRKRRM